MARKRLTRREIVQEDQIQAILSTILEWSSKNRFVLVGAVTMVLVGISGLYFWQSYQTDLSLNFQAKLAEAIEIYHAPVAENEDENSDTVSNEQSFLSDQERREKALEHFSALAAEADGYTVGDLARYYVALIKQELGHTEEAKELLNSVILNSPQTDAGNLARNLLAQIAESERDHDRAVSLLEEILGQESLSFPKDYVLLRLGQNHEAAGTTTEALGYYRRLTTDYPDSGYSQEARTRIDRLEVDTQPEGQSQSVSQN